MSVSTVPLHRFAERPLVRVALMAAALCTVAMAACGRDATTAEEDFSGRGLAGAVAGPAQANQAVSPAEAQLETSSQARASQAPDALAKAQPTAPATPSMIIRNGQVSIEVDSLEPAMAAVRQLATTLGGYVGNVSVTGGEYNVRSATLELKIPAARFEDAMTGVAPLGKVESSNASAEDVGEEFVDVTARVSNAKRLEARLITLLATRTGKLEDVLAVERELARVREEIERYEGRIRFLGSRVATSTVHVTVHERAPLVGSQPGQSVIGQAFKNMWRNFVGFIAWGIESLGFLIPLVALVWLALWWRKRRRVS